MSKDTEVDMKDVELNEVEQEKQPMTGGASKDDEPISPTGTEKNGCIHAKIPEEADVKFTGLSKEELLKIAGTPGWVRTRWGLLILFWLGWLGMLAGAIAIIVQAPKCKPIPEMNWWNLGPLYQIGNLNAFTDAGDLKGLEKKIDSLSELKVKGLILGPLHEVKVDQLPTLDFNRLSSEVGTMEDFKAVVKAAHKKSIKVILDLTPNYMGKAPWFTVVPITNVVERLKPALVFWLDIGVDGFQLSGINRVVNGVPTQWTDIRAIVQNRTDEKRVLIGVTEEKTAVGVSNLLNTSGVDLLLSELLRIDSMSGTECGQAIQQFYSAYNQTQLAWNLGIRTKDYSAPLGEATLVRLHQILLFTLPGTPVFRYGDEIGLVDQQDTPFPRMLWEIQESEKETNDTMKLDSEQKASRLFFKTLSDLRGKERSLLYGEFQLLHNSSSSLAYLRNWDQSERYMAAFNWGSEAVMLQLAHSSLPPQAKVLLSTNSKHAPDQAVDLAKLELDPQQAVLLQFPYSP